CRWVSTRYRIDPPGPLQKLAIHGGELAREHGEVVEGAIARERIGGDGLARARVVEEHADGGGEILGAKRRQSRAALVETQAVGLGVRRHDGAARLEVVEHLQRRVDAGAAWRKEDVRGPQVGRQAVWIDRAGETHRLGRRAERGAVV